MTHQQADRQPRATTVSQRGIRALTKKLVLPVPPEPKSRPLVSVVIPCFNYAHYVMGAAESALKQEGVEVEVIIVDDCSTDNSLAVARGIAEKHPNVRVIAHPINRGPVDTFNDGLAAATGTYLVRLDADDLLTPGSLARAVGVMEAHPSIGLVYGHPLHFTSELPPARTTATSVIAWPGVQWLGNRCKDGLNVITSPEVVMRKTVVDLVGGQQPLAHTHDMEMWLRISAFSDVAYLRGCDQAWHRDHDASLSARKVDTLVDFDERRAAFDTLFGGMAGDLCEAGRLRDTVERALDQGAIALAIHAADLGAQSPVAPQEFLARVRSEHDRKLAEDRITKRSAFLQRPGALRRRAVRRFRTEHSFKKWHRVGEF